MKRTKREKGEWNDRMTVNWLLLGHFNLGFLFSKRFIFSYPPASQFLSLFFSNFVPTFKMSSHMIGCFSDLSNRIYL